MKFLKRLDPWPDPWTWVLWFIFALVYLLCFFYYPEIQDWMGNPPVRWRR